MDVTLTEDQTMLQDMTRRFLEDRSPIGALRKLADAGETLDREAWREGVEGPSQSIGFRVARHVD